jgi:hypothetical protein
LILDARKEIIDHQQKLGYVDNIWRGPRLLLRVAADRIIKIDMAAKRYKKHTNKISKHLISMAYNE